MKLTIDIKEDIVLALLKLSDYSGRSFDQTVNQLLKEKLVQIKRLKGYTPKTPPVCIPAEYDELGKLLISRIKNLNSGEIFTVKTLLHDKWETIPSPRGFGWVAKKLLENNASIEVIKKTGCRKYKRI